MTCPVGYSLWQGSATRHWKLKKLDMEIDDSTEPASAGPSGRGGRGRAATLAENDEVERERFMEVSPGLFVSLPSSF